ncbi:HAD family phosphatase [Actinotalea sp. JY-7885]|uniref:HAD family hydrolase n=1 Tax=Actinotalea sp. JY-7885 TaxID=2758576 RepID=UPI00165E4F35|nr:HAD family phosphatase [Actinotalea sp. JY-7885]
MTAGSPGLSDLSGRESAATDVEAALAARLARPGAGLLLDLDGTLVDSEPLQRAAFADYFAERGWDVPDAVVRQFMGRRAVEVFPVLDGPWRGEDPVALTDAVVAQLGRTDAVPAVVPGAAELLALCADVGLPAAIVTSARREWVERALAALRTQVPGLAAPPMVTAEECVEGKPHPEPYERGARLLGLAPDGLVAAEDAPAGIASARAAGVGYVVGLTTSNAPHELPGADVALPDLRLVVAALAGGRSS